VLALLVAVVVTALVALIALIGAWRLRGELRQVHRAAAALSNGGLLGLDQVLREQGLDLRRLGDRTGELERRLGASEERLGAAIRRVGVVRFNPFRESGGDQSFVVALLDDSGAGVVLTGLHNRNDTRVYAKPVDAGVSKYPLSDEEAQAIKTALGRSQSSVPT